MSKSEETEDAMRSYKYATLTLVLQSSIYSLISRAVASSYLSFTVSDISQAIETLVSQPLHSSSQYADYLK